MILRGSNVHMVARTGALLMLALSVARPAVAQQRDTMRTDTTRPFVAGGMFDKPYETRLLGRTAIGGYAEAHARWQRVEGLPAESGLVAKRFNLFSSTRVSDVVRMGAELEFEDGGREIKLEYAAIDLRIHPAFALRGGMLLSPLGRFNLSHDSPLNEFTDRPLVSTEILGVALSEPGFGAFGQFAMGPSGRLTYEFYATNGFHDGLISEAEEGTRIPLGRGNFEDQNGSPAWVGRMALSPRLGYEVGLSAHHGAYNVFHDEGTPVDQRRNLSIIVVDLEAQVLSVEIAGEAAIATIDIPDGLHGIYAERQEGFYLEGIRAFGQGWIPTLPAAAFAAKTRIEYVDFDAQAVGQSRAQLSVGINFRPTPDSVVKLDLVRGRGRDQFNNRADHAYLLASIATYF